MNASPPHTWTIDERIDAYERKSGITVPFSAQERALAWSLAAAIHFWDYQQELPGRCLEDSKELFALDMGIARVQIIRGDLTDSTSPPTSM
jgi:hypothetical protein